MKIAISVSEGTLESPIDNRFGRAKSFMLYDTETKSFTTHDNTQNLTAAQGAGIQAGQNVVELGADCLITGHCGPKAYKVLAAGDIKLFLAVDGTVQENIKKCIDGELSESNSADVEGHWM